MKVNIIPPQRRRISLIDKHCFSSSLKSSLSSLNFILFLSLCSTQALAFFDYTVDDEILKDHPDVDWNNKTVHWTTVVQANGEAGYGRPILEGDILKGCSIFNFLKTQQN